MRKNNKMNKIDLNKYQEFVTQVTSNESSDLDALIEVLKNLNSTVNIALLLTAATGMSAEGGEFAEVVKKCVFQGKPLNEDTIFHLKRELGDVAWYWVNACTALGLDPNEVFHENVHKLESRYPGGKFDASYSENRKAGDL
jgi:NTP pyrophosphatase (non-canonical NTP hydrolase)